MHIIIRHLIQIKVHLNFGFISEDQMFKIYTALQIINNKKVKKSIISVDPFFLRETHKKKQPGRESGEEDQLWRFWE